MLERRLEKPQKMTDLLFEKIYDYDNLYSAWLEVEKGRRNEASFQQYKMRYEDLILLEIQNELIYHTYKPRKTREFLVRDPKLREISEPTYFDRIVHHALMRVVQPYFSKYFHRASFACIKNKGPLQSCFFYQKQIRRALGRWGKDFYVIHLDFKSFFASIDRDKLKEKLKRIFNPNLYPSVLWLFGTIIDSYEKGKEEGRGLPLGFLPSQQLANFTLTSLDYYITDTLGYSLYIRYMDDARILVHTKQEAKEIMYKIDSFVYENIGQPLSPNKTFAKHYRGKDTWCGYVVCPHHLEPKKATVGRAKRRLKKKEREYKDGKITKESLEASYISYYAYMKHTNKAFELGI